MKAKHQRLILALAALVALIGAGLLAASALVPTDSVANAEAAISGLDAAPPSAQKDAPMFGELDVAEATAVTVTPKLAPAAPVAKSPLDDLEDLLATSIPTGPSRS